MHSLNIIEYIQTRIVLGATASMLNSLSNAKEKPLQNPHYFLPTQKDQLCHGKYGISIGMVGKKQIEILLRKEKQTISIICKYCYYNIILFVI